MRGAYIAFGRIQIQVWRRRVKRTPLKRKSTLKARKRIQAKPRTGVEFQRVYGSKRRVEYVKQLSCVVCGNGPCENAHIKSGGIGRKAAYTDIIPLCSSCHRTQHQHGWKALSLDAPTLEHLAYLTQWRWATRPDD